MRPCVARMRSVRSARCAWIVTRREATEAAADLGFPIVLEVLSADILHKNNIGGVRLGVADRFSTEAAFDEILAPPTPASPSSPPPTPPPSRASTSTPSSSAPPAPSPWTPPSSPPPHPVPWVAPPVGPTSSLTSGWSLHILSPEILERRSPRGRQTLWPPSGGHSYFRGASLHICFGDEAGDVGSRANPSRPNDQLFPGA